MTKYADLHLHTVYSDGTYTPEELVAKSVKAKLAAIAITDHDTVGAIGPAMKLAKEVDLEILPGIELSAEYEGQEIHILGYLIDYKSKALKEKLAKLREIRVERIHKIVAKLKEMDVILPPEAVFALSGNGTVGRLHVARAMVKEGLIGCTYEAFQKYIGDKCPAYVLGFKLSPKEAVKVIKDAGGVPVLAHPYIIKDDNLLIELINSGIMGLEVYYPEHSQSMVNFYLELAKKYNLVLTGGSDCHGAAKSEVRIGSMKVPYELVEKLKEVKAKI